MKSFDELKSEILLRAENLDACETQYEAAQNCEDKMQLLSLFKENAQWCLSKGLTSSKELLEIFTIEELNYANIYTSGEHSIIARNNEILKIVTLDSSQATVKTLDSSQATVETWGSSQATVKTLDSSQAKLDAANGGLIQDRSNKKLYIKKSDFEIILLD